VKSHTVDSWEFGLWSSLSLELLARAALSHISPVLLSDAKNWRNLTYAIGTEPTKKKFSPTSIPTTEVIARLEELLPTFTTEIAGFCTQHADRRNSELHTGTPVFASLGTSTWLPKYYLSAKVLLESMDRKLEDFTTDHPAAMEMIKSLEDAAAKSVMQDIKAHAQVWKNQDESKRKEASLQAMAWATRHSGHRVQCPSCECQALVQGSPSGPVETRLDDDEIVQKQTMLPSSFECIACRLHISGLSKLSACGLGDAFTATSRYSAAEFFELYTEDDIEEARAEFPEAEPDFNEYGV
jgi:hypothetical protein